MQTVSNLIYADAISVERISYLINEKGISPEIAALDLEMVKMKLREPEEGKNWSAEQCQNAEVEYKRYLHLCQKYGKGIVPNKIMDTMWHFHILDTRAYHQDCEQVFGHYLHHFPYFGMRGEEDAQNLKKSFENTQMLYFQSFNESMIRAEGADCWHDCESRCWHACANQD